MIKGNFKLIDVTLKLLLDAKSLGLCPLFGIKGCLKRVHSTEVILTSVFKLLNLLCNFPINLLTDLSKLKLSPENLILFLLKSSLSFFKSSLKLHLLSLQTLPDFVNFMNGSTSFTDLVHNVLNFIAQGLILFSDFIKLENSFLIG